MKDVGGSQFPPTTYNLTERAFRPGLSFGQSIDGLNDTVMRLHNQGLFRSALDEIFKVLDKDPDNSQALELALIVVGQIRTVQIQAQEPLTPAYLLDRRLDPIVTVCSRCRKSWIGGDPLLFPGLQLFQSLIMINSGAPRPMQCYNCGYVLCSECIIQMMSDDPLAPGDIPKKCPNCGRNELKRPAYPTGRPPQQMARHIEPVVQVIVFREGPVPPDEEFLRGFLASFSPDALIGSSKLVGIPVSPWPPNIEALALSTLLEKETQGEIPARSVQYAEFAHASDEYGNRIYVAKVIMPPSPEEKLVEDSIRTHISRMIQAVQNTPNSAMELEWRRLLHPTILAFTQKTILKELQKSLSANQHLWQSRHFDDVYLIISTVPIVDPTKARNYFQGGYLKFFDAQVQNSTIPIGSCNFAHWIYCCDGNRAGLHLTFLPKGGTAVLALELLSDVEKSQLGFK